MSAVKLMGETIRVTADPDRGRTRLRLRQARRLRERRQRQPFMAGAFHGVQEADTTISVGVSWTRRGTPRPAEGPGRIL